MAPFIGPNQQGVLGHARKLKFDRDSCPHYRMWQSQGRASICHNLRVHADAHVKEALHNLGSVGGP